MQFCVSVDRVGYIIAHCVCLMQLYFKYESDGKCRRKFRCHSPGEPLPSKQSIYKMANKLKTTGSLLGKKTERTRAVLTEEELDGVGTRLAASPRKSPKRLAQEKSFENVCTKGQELLTLLPYKTTVFHALQDKVYATNPYTLDELRNNVRREISTVSPKNS